MDTAVIVIGVVLGTVVGISKAVDSWTVQKRHRSGAANVMMDVVHAREAAAVIHRRQQEGYRLAAQSGKKRKTVLTFERP